MIIRKYTNKIFKKFQANKIVRKFTNKFTRHLDFNDKGQLSDKYYKSELAPNMITDNLIESFSTQEISKTPKEILEDKSNPLSNFKKQLFPTEEKEKAFLEDKNLKFNLPRPMYKQFLEKGMIGDAIKLSHKNLELFVIGTMYDRISPANLYKVLNYVKPDLVLLQMRPDRMLSGIEKYYKKDPEILLEKLTRNSYEIQPSYEIKEKMRKMLLDKGFMINSKKSVDDELYKNFKSIESNQSERLSNEALSLISLWGEQKDSKVVLSDMPESIMIERLANSLSLMQIRQMFEEIFTQFPNNPDWEPRTPLGTAINLYPDLFVNPTDAYLAQSIDNLAKIENEKNPNKITKAVAFVGYGQTLSLPFYMNYDLDRNSMTNLMTPPCRFKNLITGEDKLEVLAEKWCLLSLIFNGVEGVQSENKISQMNFPIVEGLIKKNARDDMIKTGFNSESHLINRTSHLFRELMIDKTNSAVECIGKGYELKKKTFMRKIFNDPMLNSQLV
jgi:hypothetical protein